MAPLKTRRFSCMLLTCASLACADQFGIPVTIAADLVLRGVAEPVRLCFAFRYARTRMYPYPYVRIQYTRTPYMYCTLSNRAQCSSNF